MLIPRSVSERQALITRLYNIERVIKQMVTIEWEQRKNYVRILRVMCFLLLPRNNLLNHLRLRKFHLWWRDSQDGTHGNFKNFFFVLMELLYGEFDKARQRWQNGLTARQRQWGEWDAVFSTNGEVNRVNLAKLWLRWVIADTKGLNPSLDSKWNVLIVQFLLNKARVKGLMHSLRSRKCGYPPCSRFGYLIKLNKCKSCRIDAYYCSTECQKEDWPVHRMQHL